MRKKYIFIFVIILILIILFSISYAFIFQEKEIPIDNSSFTLIDNMKVEVYSDTMVSSKIDNINGSVIEDKKIDTSVLGNQTIEFLYENEKGKKRKGAIEVEVVDTTKPIIMLHDSYSVTVGYDKNLTDIVLSADNYDPSPVREIVGEYDINQVGSYNLTYKVTDSSGNVTLNDFTLYVKEKSSGTSYSSTYTEFSSIVSLHKTDSTKIGIDVSKWQGDIDFDALKNAGVEFIIIRVGTQLGFEESSIEDLYFRKNIEGATNVGIPVGIYYFSYATSETEAKEQASWVINQLKDYKIELPVAFDWESWSYFNGLNLSLYDINSIASVFLSEIEAAGYNGILYGSRNYLQNVWEPTEPVWLAHYTAKTNYEGDYMMWQLCDNGKVNGIQGAVDINIMYE